MTDFISEKELFKLNEQIETNTKNLVSVRTVRTVHTACQPISSKYILCMHRLSLLVSSA